MDEPSTAVRTYLTSEHADVLEGVAACANAVADHWDGPMSTDRGAVVGPLQACLQRSGVHERLPGVLAGAVAAAGRSLRAQPVAAPPYVVVTSVGPVLRGTTDQGRLVVTLRVFDVQRRTGDAEPRYVRTDDQLAVDVDVK